MPPIFVSVEMPSPSLLAESMSFGINQDITKHVHSMKYTEQMKSSHAIHSSMKCSDDKESCAIVTEGSPSNLQGTHT